MNWKQKYRLHVLRVREIFGIIPEYVQDHGCTQKNCKDCFRHDNHYYCKAYDRFMSPNAIPCKYAVENGLLKKQRKYRLIIKKGKNK